MRTLLNLLSSFWLYPVLGTMLAAGAGVLDGAGGGGDGSSGGDSSGAGGDQGGSGDVSGSEGLEDSGDSADGADGGAASRQDGADGADQNALVDSGDGRKIPARYQELFKNDKTLREMYFNNAALRKTFPGGVKEAVGLAKAVEKFGGVEGVEQLQSDLETYHADSQLFESNQAEWIKTGFQENSEAALKAFAHSLDYVAENHPEQYDHFASKIVVNTMTGESSPLPVIQNFLLSLKDNPEAQKLAAANYKFYKDLETTASKVPEKQIDPQQKKLDARQADLEKKDQAIRNKSINSESVPYLNRGIDGGVDKAAQAAGFDVAKVRAEQPKRYAKFVQDVKNTIYATVRGDEAWLDRYSRTLASGDTAKCVRMLNARHDQAIKGTASEPGVVESLFTEWFGAPKAGHRQNAGRAGNRHGNQGGTRPGNAGGTGKETPVLVNALPAAKDINYNDPITNRWEGIYRLKTGKLIQVKRP